MNTVSVSGPGTSPKLPVHLEPAWRELEQDSTSLLQTASGKYFAVSRTDARCLECQHTCTTDFDQLLSHRVCSTEATDTHIQDSTVSSTIGQAETGNIPVTDVVAVDPELSAKFEACLFTKRTVHAVTQEYQGKIEQEIKKAYLAIGQHFYREWGFTSLSPGGDLYHPLLSSTQKVQIIFSAIHATWAHNPRALKTALIILASYKVTRDVAMEAACRLVEHSAELPRERECSRDYTYRTGRSKPSESRTSYRSTRPHRRSHRSDYRPDTSSGTAGAEFSPSGTGTDTPEYKALINAREACLVVFHEVPHPLIQDLYSRNYISRDDYDRLLEPGMSREHGTARSRLFFRCIRKAVEQNPGLFHRTVNTLLGREPYYREIAVILQEGFYHQCNSQQL